MAPTHMIQEWMELYFECLHLFSVNKCFIPSTPAQVVQLKALVYKQRLLSHKTTMNQIHYMFLKIRCLNLSKQSCIHHLKATLFRSFPLGFLPILRPIQVLATHWTLCSTSCITTCDAFVYKSSPRRVSGLRWKTLLVSALDLNYYRGTIQLIVLLLTQVCNLRGGVPFRLAM